MRIYNTLNRQIEEFKPIKPGEVMIYACGPTVYNYIHIGNARPIIVFDCFRRYLKYRGYKVRYVQNFTDIDDKIIKKANEENTSAAKIAEKYIKEYEQDAKGLGVEPPSIAPRVTESIELIIDIVEKLIKNNHAYEVNGDVYFDTKSFIEYGKLSHMPLEQLDAGKRVEVNSVKNDPMDFAIWKAVKPDEPYWDSPWGKGRPGWHIECSAMATKYLAPTIDIHCGGQDLIFPHHENEIAQSECATGAVFANYWMHNGYINIDNRKMSKSKGNFFTVRDVAEKYGYEPIRYMMLQAHYRTPINYNAEIIEQCKASLARINTFKDNLAFIIKKSISGNLKDEDKKVVNLYRDRFIKVMDDDFNTSDGISVIFEFIRDMNSYVSGTVKTSKEHLILIKELFDELTGVLGITSKSNALDEIPSEVVELFERRKEARKAKDFSLADELRDKITSYGYMVEETRQGSRLVPMNK